MKRTWIAMLTVAVALLAAEVAGAHDVRTQVDRRQAFQRARIRAGWRHGQLSHGERLRLAMGQARIHRFERLAWQDGRLSLRERRLLHRMQNREHRAIARLRHNRWQ